jgi:heme/copper-type cytochrome/quinol oxidase subunit 2
VGGFHPNWIEVSKGDRVTIELTSEQGTHSLAIPEYGVKSQPEYGVKSQPVGEGQTTTINFVADKPQS